MTLQIEAELTEAEATAIHDACCFWIDALNAELADAPRETIPLILAGFMAAADEVWDQHMPKEH